MVADDHGGRGDAGWVYTDGAASISFGTGASGTDEIGPLPWDATYLSKLGTFITAVGARYGSDAALAKFGIAGINWDSGETKLPNSAGGIAGADTTWSTAGYTQELIESAWQTLLTDWAATGKSFAGEHGRNFLPALPSDDTSNLMSIAAADYPNQYIAQNNAAGKFGPAYIWPPLRTFIGVCQIGVQMNGPVGSTVGATVAAAAAANASYVEVYPADLPYLPTPGIAPPNEVTTMDPPPISASTSMSAVQRVRSSHTARWCHVLSQVRSATVRPAAPGRRARTPDRKSSNVKEFSSGQAA